MRVEVASRKQRYVSQPDTDKALAAEERSQETRSFVRRIDSVNCVLCGHHIESGARVLAFASGLGAYRPAFDFRSMLTCQIWPLFKSVGDAIFADQGGGHELLPVRNVIERDCGGGGGEGERACPQCVSMSLVAR